MLDDLLAWSFALVGVAFAAYQRGRFVEQRFQHKEIDRLNNIIDGFYDAIAHGSDDHKLWLRMLISDYLMKNRKV